DSGCAEHRVGVEPGLQPADLAHQPRARLGRVGADLHRGLDHRVRLRAAAGRPHGRGETRSDLMRRGTREYAYWSITILLVLAFAMLPVLWIVSLSLKTPESVTDGSFIPHHWTLDNYNALFQGGFTNGPFLDRKSTRLNSSHLGISYAV